MLLQSLFFLFLFHVSFGLSFEDGPSCRAICVEAHRNFASYALRHFDSLHLTDQIFKDICFTIESFNQCYSKCPKVHGSACVLDAIKIPGAACALDFLQVAQVPECYNKLKSEVVQIELVKKCRQRCCDTETPGSNQTPVYSFFYCSDHNIDSLQFLSDPHPASQAKKNDLCQVTCIMNALGILAQPHCSVESVNFFTSVGAILHKFHSEQEYCLDHILYNDEPKHVFKVKVEF